MRLIEGFLDWERRKVGAHVGPHDDRVEVHDHFFRRLVELKINLETDCYDAFRNM